MRHMNSKLVKLLHEGFSMTTLENLNEKQLNVLYRKITEDKGSVRMPADKADPAKLKALTDQGINVEMSEDMEDPMDFEKGQRTQDPKQVGPNTNDGQDNYGDGMSEDVMDSDPTDEKGKPVKKSNSDDVLRSTEPEVNVKPSELKIYDLDTPSDKMKLYNNPSELADLINKNNNDDGEGRQMRSKIEKEIVLDTKYYFTTKHLGPNRKVIVYNYRTGEVSDVSSKKVLFKFEKKLPQLQVYYELRDYGVIRRNRKIQHGPDIDKAQSNLQEKAVSKQQQKIMGLALSVKKGDTPKSKVSKSVQKMAKEMSKKELEDFASTKHKGLPKTVDEKEEVEKLEESILRIIENHLPPHTTKGELLNYIRRNA